MDQESLASTGTMIDLHIFLEPRYEDLDGRPL